MNLRRRGLDDDDDDRAGDVNSVLAKVVLERVIGDGSSDETLR